MTRWLALLLAVGCAKQPAAPTPDGSVPPAQAALLISDTTSDWNRGNQFRLSGTRDLFVRVVAPSLPQQTMLALRFVNPRGELFYEDHAPFTTSDQPVMVDIEMFHGPKLATQAEAIPGGWQVTRMVPILGTIFQRSGDTEGGWGVTAELDGVPGALTTTVVFTR